MRLIRSAGETITPSDDGCLFRQMLPDGVFGSLSITVSGGDIVLPAFKGIMCGRDFSVDAMTLTPALPTGGTVVSGKIIVRIDLTQEAGSQLSVVGVLNPYTLTTDDINESGGVLYEIEIGTYKGNIGGVTEATSTANSVDGIPADLAAIQSDYTAKFNRVLVKNVTTSSDLNSSSYTTQGVYYFGVSYAPTHAPSGNTNGFLWVLNQGTYTKQIWLRTGTVGTNDTETYIRTGQSGTWSNWDRVLTRRGRKVEDLTISRLNSLTWTQASGVWYSSDITPTNDFTRIESITITNWGVLNGVIIPYIHGTKVALMSASGTFTNSSNLTIRIVGD